MLSISARRFEKTLACFILYNLRCWDELPDFCAGHAAYVVRHRGDDVFKAAPGLRSLKSRLNVSPSGAFCVVLASALAILDVVWSHIETGIITSKSIFVVLTRAHPGSRRYTPRDTLRDGWF
jgi:hypothetical protein